MFNYVSLHALVVWLEAFRLKISLVIIWNQYGLSIWKTLYTLTYEVINYYQGTAYPFDKRLHHVVGSEF